MPQNTQLTLLGLLLLPSFITATPLDMDSTPHPKFPTDFSRWAKRAEPSILRRQANTDTTGSWSLRTLTCPSGTTKCDSPLTATACCPDNLTCVSWIFKRACCPSKDRCDQVALSFPRCADSSWSLWNNEVQDGYFCCLPGEKGFIAKNGGGGCVAENFQLLSTQVATSVVPYGVGGGGQSIPTTVKSGNGGSNSVNNVAPSYKATASPSPSSSGSGTGSGTGTGSGSEYGSGSGANTSNSGSNSPTTTTNNKLGTGALAGIIVGAIAGTIFVAAAIILAIRWGKRRGEERARLAFLKEQQNQQMQLQQEIIQPPIKGSGPGIGYVAPVEEYHTRPEIDGHGVPQGYHNRVEIDGQERRGM